jgi:phytoene/squalene synthetase
MTTQPHGRGGLTLACRLLPRDLRPDVNALYTVFRTLDDLVDEGDASVAAARVAAVERWCESGSVTSAEAAALDAIEARRGVPAGPLRAFCEGMRHDLDGGVLVTEDDVDRYCGQVAGSVGEVMTVWLGQRWPCLDRARSLGVALQRTNILRDLDEALARGRVYVAAETLRSRSPTRGTTKGSPASGAWRGAARRSPRQRRRTVRSCGRSSARVTAGAPAGSSSRGRAVRPSPPAPRRPPRTRCPATRSSRMARAMRRAAL